MAVIFVTKMENGQKSTQGLCMKCAKEMGVPIDNIVGNVMNQFGISPEQLESAEADLGAFLADTPSDADDNEDGGAPAIDLPKLFRDARMMAQGNVELPTDPKPADGEGKKKEKKKGKEEKKLKFLTTYCRNLTKFAREGKLDQLVGRERELARVIQILCRRQKNNPCLIGEPGVGKTAIAEGLAMRIVEGNVPYKPLNKEIYLLDMTALVAGTQFRWQFESRIQGLLGEVHELVN
ncbi:MAG: ATP-dependent Clp protease ATP-binding subunit, partial [Clostridia bacterium]|nr:ATP-dependent Clp protease ATP-binding subunit [Clostridia bacterium]